MKKITFVLGLLLSFAFCASAQDEAVDSVKVIREVECPADGTLEAAVGEDWAEIDSLIVKGFVHQADFPTMNRYCIHGRLSGIDLSGCEIEDNLIPEKAFDTIDFEAGIRVRNLKYITFPKSLKNIGRWAFFSSGLKQLTLPDGMEELAAEVFYCNEDMSGTLRIPEGIKDIPLSCFYRCLGITELELPSTLKSIGILAFSQLDLHGTLVIPEGVETIGEDAFYLNSHLNEVYLPSSMIDIGEAAFLNCSKLTKVHNFPMGVGYIPNACFMNCRIEYWEFPDDIKFVGSEAFMYNCFHDLILPDAIETIGRWAFMGIGNLNSVRLPKNLTLLGEAAFVDCKNLTKVYAQNPEPPEIFYAIDDMFEQMVGTRGIFDRIHPKAVLYVPIGAKDAYMRAGWNEWFADVQEYDYATEMSVVQADESVTVSRHALDGTRLQHPTRGLNIVRMKDGSVRKVIVR